MLSIGEKDATEWGNKGENIDRRVFPGEEELDKRTINGRSPVERRG